uniref:Peptidase A1 domain-containing protein n=1 Tax=Acrobeloides nanus TaxID=290746 RepID=A0A914EFV8_9BILA
MNLLFPLTFFVALCPLVLWAMPLDLKQEPGVYRMKIQNTPSLRAKLIKEGKWKHFLEELHTNKASGSQPFIDYYDDFYLANVTTGTPPQQFTIAPDTGSSNYWIIDANKCKNQACQGYPGYASHNRFDSTKSTTFKNLGTPFSIQYGSGSCDGTLAVDVLSFAGLSIPTQTFGLASSIADVFGYQPIDGIMGLGWPALAIDNVVPPMQNLLSQLNKPLFTVWLDRHVQISQGGSGGVITYGDIDTTNCDATINYVPLSSKRYWQFSIASFSVGTYSNKRQAQVISDTGTSWIYGPTAAVDAIAQATNAIYDDDNGIYTVPCTATGLPDWVFNIGGINYNIPSSEYVLDLELGDGNCALTLGDGSDLAVDGFQWILGDTFIRTYCNIYDIAGGRIGFAKAHHTGV